MSIDLKLRPLFKITLEELNDLQCNFEIHRLAVT